MRLSTYSANLFNAAIAGGYGVALLLATVPILDLYGITPNPEGAYMARWFGLGLLGIGLTTCWLGMPPIPPGGRRWAGRWRSPTASAWSWPCGGRLSGPFNALGWLAVGLNLLLGSGFVYVQRSRPRATSDTPA